MSPPEGVRVKLMKSQTIIRAVPIHLISGTTLFYSNWAPENCVIPPLLNCFACVCMYCMCGRAVQRVHWPLDTDQDIEASSLFSLTYTLRQSDLVTCHFLSLLFVSVNWFWQCVCKCCVAFLRTQTENLQSPNDDIISAHWSQCRIQTKYGHHR